MYPGTLPSVQELTERDVDIVRATAGHYDEAGLEHTVQVAGTVADGGAFGIYPSVRLDLNTDSDKDREFFVYYDFFDAKFGVYKDTANGGRHVGKAIVGVRDGIVTYLPSRRSIGNPRRYGWAFTTAHSEFPDSDSTYSVSAEDRIPSENGYLKRGQR